jgi:hypothetical protein
MTDFHTAEAARVGLAITALTLDVQRLHAAVVDGDPRWAPGESHQLAMVGQSLDLLTDVRNTLLVRLRDRRVSWKSISKVTEVAVSTWRDRYTKAIGGTSAP